MTRSPSAQPDPVTPLVTVIVCTRDRPDGLRRALQSVQWQELSVPRLAVEVVVVDDGNTPPAAPDPGERFPVRVVRIDDGRPGAARKAGLVAARGAVIAWCDDDDTWAPHHLATVVPPLLEPDPPALVAAYDGDPREAPASTVAVRAEAARDAGGFDPGLDAFEDWDLWHRLGRSSPLRAVPVSTVAIAPPSRRDRLVYPVSWQRIEADENRFRQRRRHNARARSFTPQTPFDPTCWQRGERRLLFQAAPDPTRSLGFVARRLI
jgi:glycosyltransferase involved in cell wall biosynthesis